MRRNPQTRNDARVVTINGSRRMPRIYDAELAGWTTDDPRAPQGRKR